MSFGKLLFSFKGRIGRHNYWILIISIGMVALLLEVVLNFLKPAWAAGSADISFSSFIALLICIFPTTACQVKRFHDRGKSGWWVLIAFIPIIGPVWMIVELGFLKGTDGPNRFGPDPLVDPVAALDGA